MSDDYQHCRWWSDHEAVPAPGSFYETRWGQLEAVCASCGEAIVRCDQVSAVSP